MIPTPTKYRNRRPTKIPATFVGMLVDGLSDREIAAKLGVHRSTIAEWSARPDIRAMVDQSQAEFVAEVRRRGKSLLVRAVDAIDILESRGQPLAAQAIRTAMGVKAA